jgi:hypothetical protein
MRRPSPLPFVALFSLAVIATGRVPPTASVPEKAAPQRASTIVVSVPVAARPGERERRNGRRAPRS